MVRAHADAARLRALAPDALRPRAVQVRGGGTRVPVAARGRLPQVSGSIDGVEGMFEIDTGSRGSLTLAPAFAAKNDLAKKRWARRTSRSPAPVSAGRCARVSARGKMLKLGARRRAQSHRGHPQGRRRDAAKTDVSRATSASRSCASSRSPTTCRTTRCTSSATSTSARPTSPIAAACGSSAAGRLQGRRRGGRRPGGSGGPQGRRRDRRGQRLSGAQVPLPAVRETLRAIARLARQGQDGRGQRGHGGAEGFAVAADVPKLRPTCWTVRADVKIRARRDRSACLHRTRAVQP